MEVRTSATFTLNKVSHRGPDLGLIRVRGHFKAQRALAVLLGDALFGYDGPLDDFVNGRHYCQALRKFLGGRFGQQHLLMTQQIVDVNFAARHQLHAFQIAAGKLQIAILGVIHQQHRPVRFEPVQGLAHQLGLRLGNREILDHSQFAVPQLGRERAAQRAQHASCAADDRNNRAVAAHASCRRDATAGCGSSPCAPARCPSASTASCPTRPLHAASWSSPSRAALPAR